MIYDPTAGLGSKHVWKETIRPSRLVRILPAALRVLRLSAARLRHPRASFGRNVDLRCRFCLRQSQGALVSIGESCILDNDLTIECRGRLIIGDRTIFGHHCTIGVLDEVIIGSDCLIAEMVSIRDHNHCFDLLDIPVRKQGMSVATIRIGNNVWLAGKVTIAAGVTIGDNVVVGANAVVTCDLPANSVAAGVPARVIRMRSNTLPLARGDNSLCKS
jgi:acetyltransferase-like isoleucine patch superfamily enzyme